MIKKPKILEKHITKSIRDYLNIRKIFHWKNLAGLGSMKGVPDILGVLPDGRALMIEVKTAKGEISDHQKAFMANAEKAGACVFVARGVTDLIERGI